MAPAISAVVNLHEEGQAATTTLISAWRATERAQAAGIEVEIILLLDQPNTETREITEQWRHRASKIVECDAGDLGEARNTAVEASSADWVAFLDGDDLWGESWLTSAFTAATTATPSPWIDVWHPHVNVIFGDHHSLLHHLPSTDPAFSWARFRLHNSWTALSFVRRSVVARLPFPRNDLESGFGFEDWSWNAEVLRRGGRHKVVPDTCHFIRRTTAPSLLGRSQKALRTPYPMDPMAVYVDATTIAGATTSLSEVTPTDPDLPFTYRRSPVSFSEQIDHDLRLALTIEPAIGETIRTSSSTTPLPQNFNRYVGEPQRALESLDLAASEAKVKTVAELCSRSSELAALEPSHRASVVAEVLLDPLWRLIPRGESDLISEAVAAYPQLEWATW